MGFSEVTAQKELNGRDPAAARDQADVRLGAKTVYFMNTILLKSKRIMHCSKQEKIFL
jgi:hypothetical protein